MGLFDVSMAGGKNTRNESVIRYWLKEYKEDMRIYRVKLTHPSTESRIALFKHLSECSIEEFEKLYILRMKRATGCVDGDEIRLDMMGEAVVLAIVRCIKNKGEVKGGSKMN